MKLALKRLLITTIIATLIFAGTAYGDSTTPSKLDVEKQETVYVNLNPNGSTRQIIASNWLKNSRGIAALDDETILENITPVSSALLISNEQGKLTWQSDDQDVYYQSEVDKALPIDVTIDYTLDGKPIEPEDLAGKSGHVTIRVAFTNKSVQSFMINGSQSNLATPFTTVTAVPLPNDIFSNVTVDNGQIFSDGNNQMVILIGFPALNESLELKSLDIDELMDIDFPDEFLIEADAEEFDLATIAIAASPELPDMIKDLKNDRDMDEDIADVDALLEAKHTIEEVDPEDSIKNLIDDPEQTENARSLVDDLFEFYDLDTAIIEEMPEYVTDANIALYDRIKEHLETYHLEAVLDNPIIKYIPDRMDSAHIELFRKLLGRYDELQELDVDRFNKVDDVLDDRFELREFFDSAKALMDDVNDHRKQLAHLDVLIDHREDIVMLLTQIQSDAMTTELNQEDIAFMLNALAEKKSREALEKYSGLIPQDGKLNPQSQAILKGMVDQKIAAGDIAATSGAAIKMIIDGGQLPPQVQAQFMMMIKADVNRQVDASIDAAEDKLASFYGEYSTIVHDLEEDLGDDYRQDLKKAFDYMEELKKKADDLRDDEERLHDKIMNAKDLMDNEEDVSYFIEWKEKLLDMKDDMDANEENVAIAKDLLAQYDIPEIKEFYDNISILRDDMEEARPILKSFKETMEEPANDRALHDMPRTLDSLIDLRRNILNNRELADTLKLSLSDDVVESARNVLDIIDRKDEDDKLEDMREKLVNMRDLNDKNEIIKQLSEDYNSFTGKRADTNSTVRFVFKTDPIEKPEEVKEYKPVEKKAPSFLEWITGFFHRD